MLKTEGFCSLEDSGGSSATEQWDSELGECESADGIQYAGEVLTVNEHSLGIGEVDNHYELSVIFTIVNVGNSAGFNVISKDL